MAGKPKQSKYFRDLIKNLDKIENTFLSMKIRTYGSYNLQELSMARAYGLLVHAEIEHYFENIARDVVLKSYKKWISDKKGTHRLYADMFRQILLSSFDWRNVFRIPFDVNQTATHSYIYVGTQNL